jgi:hypothetical protein
MSQIFDVWYIRFPDGRVFRAASTAAVRQHLTSGRIPVGSTVRRSPDDEWVALSWTQEFADLANLPAPRGPSAGARRPAGEPATIASRLDPIRLQLLGLRGLAEELQAALDSALVRRKLAAAALAGLLLGVLAAVSQLPTTHLRAGGSVLGGCLAGAALVVAAAVTAVLTRMTYLELSQLKPAGWRESLGGLVGLVLRLVIAAGLVLAVVLGLIVLLRWLPYWLLAGGQPEGATRQTVVDVVVVVTVLAEVALWPFFAFVLLLGPLLVVEDCSVVQGWRQWLALLRQHLGRAYLYEAMAAGLGVAVALPLAFPLLAFTNLYLDERLLVPALFTRTVLFGLALSPLLAYLVVANVFIYLNLRYGWEGR